MIIRPIALRSSRVFSLYRAAMSSSSKTSTYFGPFEVTDQVFYSTQLSYALVNIKPLLPGHVLVIPYRNVQRLTDLTPAEVGDLFNTVQKVQKMLARNFFAGGSIEGGSFNIAIQDGRDAGQTVPHVHCHIIPRPKGSQEGDEIYERLASEEGNVGGGLWDIAERPAPPGRFPKIRDEARIPRSKVEMHEEAALFGKQMTIVDKDS